MTELEGEKYFYSNVVAVLVFKLTWHYKLTFQFSDIKYALWVL